MKPIETHYKGYRFRSRLEARWAVFFDALGYRWEYEPEGFELGFGERYLPDFRLFNRFYCEVKPRGTVPDSRFEKFAQENPTALLLSGDPVDFLDGLPPCPHCGYLDGPDERGTYDPVMEGWYCFGCDHEARSEGAGVAGFFSRFDRGYRIIARSQERDFQKWCERVQKAAIAARSARFEFGEQG